MLFPPSVKVVFAMDGSGVIKARLRPGRAARDVRRGKAKKLSDNAIQYYHFWHHAHPIALKDDEIVLLGTISRYTKKSKYLVAKNPEIVAEIFRHNKSVVRSALPNLKY